MSPRTLSFYCEPNLGHFLPFEDFLLAVLLWYAPFLSTYIVHNNIILYWYNSILRTTATTIVCLFSNLCTFFACRFLQQNISSTTQNLEITEIYQYIAPGFHMLLVVWLCDAPCWMSLYSSFLASCIAKLLKRYCSIVRHQKHFTNTRGVNATAQLSAIKSAFCPFWRQFWVLRKSSASRCRSKCQPSRITHEACHPVCLDMGHGVLWNFFWRVRWNWFACPYSCAG